MPENSKKRLSSKELIEIRTDIATSLLDGEDLKKILETSEEDEIKANQLLFYIVNESENNSIIDTTLTRAEESNDKVLSASLREAKKNQSPKTTSKKTYSKKLNFTPGLCTTPE